MLFVPPLGGFNYSVHSVNSCSFWWIAGTGIAGTEFLIQILQFVLFVPPLGGFYYSVHSVNYLPSVSGSSTNLVFVFVEVGNYCNFN